MRESHARDLGRNPHCRGRGEPVLNVARANSRRVNSRHCVRLRRPPGTIRPPVASSTATPSGVGPGSPCRAGPREPTPELKGVTGIGGSRSDRFRLDRTRTAPAVRSIQGVGPEDLHVPTGRSTVAGQRVREEIKGATEPSLLRGEFIRACGLARASASGRRAPLVFRRQSLQYLAVTSRRLVVFRAPPRRRRLTTDRMVAAKRHDTLALELARRSFLRRLKLQIRGIGNQGIVLTFAPRYRGVARELEMLLQAAAAARAVKQLPKPQTLQHELAPLADEIGRRVLHDAPWTARPAFDGALRSLGWVEAQLVYLRSWVDQHGMIGVDGRLHDAVVIYERLEGQAETLRADLGLTPVALATLLDSLGRMAALSGDDNGFAMLKAEAQRIVNAPHGVLHSGQGGEDPRQSDDGLLGESDAPQVG
jgi:hypothetical protein